MRRREFIASVGAAAAWPATVQAQQGKLPTVGLLGPTTSKTLALFRPHLSL
jgi:hypothetical protein